jgi:hypothetical protein
MELFKTKCGAGVCQAQEVGLLLFDPQRASSGFAASAPGQAAPSTQRTPSGSV